MRLWVWQHKNWPNFQWDESAILPHLSQARLIQGRLLGIAHLLHPNTTLELDQLTLSEQAINTSAIEGESLNRDSVRSSIARRLGIENAGIHSPTDRYIEGLLDVLLDAATNYTAPLTLERLYSWHAALFPTGYSGIHKIEVGTLRAGPMKIISGRPGKGTLHYEAPPSDTLQENIKVFLNWFNQKSDMDGLLRAGLAHLWFELIHPFDDGNGRVGRAITDLALSQDEQLATRYYSLSTAIIQARKQYYAELETSCHGDMDITAWLIWFLQCFSDAISHSLDIIADINAKNQFWQKHTETVLNERQIKVLNRLLDAGEKGFDGGMTTKKYVALTKVSRATAYRELNDLVIKKCLYAVKVKGRSAAYQIKW